ncbi:MAG: hypothetical protein AB1467_01125 [Candidatus Diapherotrites archaeon]
MNAVGFFAPLSFLIEENTPMFPFEMNASQPFEVVFPLRFLTIEGPVSIYHPLIVGFAISLIQ